MKRIFSEQARRQLRKRKGMRIESIAKCQRWNARHGTMVLVEVDEQYIPADVKRRPFWVTNADARVEGRYAVVDVVGVGCVPLKAIRIYKGAK